MKQCQRPRLRTPRVCSILSGLLAGRYALDMPMFLFASIVFEQSSGDVEGDSASAAELYALPSAPAELPLRQDLAVTGSVNQHGQFEAIGGENAKIEDFFDICRMRLIQEEARCAGRERSFTT